MSKKVKRAPVYKEIPALDNEYSMAYVFQKPRLFTYLMLLVCPPYGLWRLYKSPVSELFRANEKVVWTLIVAVYLSQLIHLLLFV